MGVGVGVKEPELVGGGVVMGGPAPVLSNLDHPGFEGVGGGAVGGMGGPAGMLDPSMGMGGAGGPFSSPAGADYNSMAASIPMDSPTPLLQAGHGGPQPQNFTDTQVSCVLVCVGGPLYVQGWLPEKPSHNDTEGLLTEREEVLTDSVEN